MDAQQPRAGFGMRPNTPATAGTGQYAAAPGGAVWPGSSAVPGPAPARGTKLPVTWVGSPWSLTGLSFLNFFLSIVTLGIYGFWGRTEVRKRVWSSVRLAGEPLEYTGTGKELFLGFLFVLGVVIVPLLLVAGGAQFAFGPKHPGTIIVQLVLYLFFFYLVGVAMYRARRYRLTRTNWRGIRGTLANNGWGYGWTSFWTLLFIPLPLILISSLASYVVGPSIAGQMFTWRWAVGIGLLLLLVAWLYLVPWRATKLYRQITNDMTFGNKPFSFVGSARPLYARFVARWVGVVILVIAAGAAIQLSGIGPKFKAIMDAQAAGVPEAKLPKMTTREIVWLIAIVIVSSFLYSVITAWYRAAQANILAGATRFEGVPLKLNVTAGGLIWLFVTNYLVLFAPAAILALAAWGVMHLLHGMGAMMAMNESHVGIAGAFAAGILKPVAEARQMKFFVERFGFGGPVDLERIAQSQATLGKTGEGLAQAFDVDAF